MSRANVATYRIVRLAICSFLLFGCGGGGSTPPQDGTLLSSLSITGVNLAPAFSPTITFYRVTVPFGTSSVDVSATRNSDNATFSINNGSNNANATVALAVGDNTISILVTVPITTLGGPGVATRLYTIVVTRASFVIDTTVGWDGQENLAPFGKGNIVPEGLEVYGQTFVAPANAPTIQRLSFWLEHSPNDTSGEDVFFSVVVMAWNTDRATGPVLFESTIQSITAAQSTMTEYSFDTGGLTLVPGQEYVAFLNATNGFWNTTSTLIRVGFQNAEIYAQGAAWTLNTDNNSNFTQSPWNNPFGTADLVVMFSFE